MVLRNYIWNTTYEKIKCVLRKFHKPHIFFNNQYRVIIMENSLFIDGHLNDIPECSSRTFYFL